MIGTPNDPKWPVPPSRSVGDIFLELLVIFYSCITWVECCQKSDEHPERQFWRFLSFRVPFLQSPKMSSKLDDFLDKKQIDFH